MSNFYTKINLVFLVFSCSVLLNTSLFAADAVIEKYECSDVEGTITHNCKKACKAILNMDQKLCEKGCDGEAKWLSEAGPRQCKTDKTGPTYTATIYGGTCLDVRNISINHCTLECGETCMSACLAGVEWMKTECKTM